MERKKYCSRRCGILHQHATGSLPKVRKIGPEGLRWKGGRFVRGGYVYVWVAKQAYKAEHRLVMEQKLGRPLRRVEHVHHLNGVRDDNRPENLELWEKPHPTGVRHAQKHCPTCTCFD
jgi:hypothetical protein